MTDDGSDIFRALPVELRAKQWLGSDSSKDELAEWMDSVSKNGALSLRQIQSGRAPEINSRLELYVKANDSWLPLEHLEWVALDENGFYPIKPFTFARKYYSPNRTPIMLPGPTSEELEQEAYRGRDGGLYHADGPARGTRLGSIAEAMRRRDERGDQ
ncbi:hypothetical protein SEA_SCENTAE_207 [Gordonia phage SCentae]|nr:hypothetical protein SEA_SCENTAE_207 [Gordonia phage SCentae]